MANPEHVEILKQGVEVWNQWREENPDVRPDLQRIEMKGCQLTGINFREAILDEANFMNSNLSNSNMYQASLSVASFRQAILNDVILNEANLSRADLVWADLRESGLVKTDLFDSDLRSTIFAGAQLKEANFDNAVLGDTSFRNTDLSHVKGLNSCHHFAPSSIDHITLKSSSNLPDGFLRGVGYTDWEIEQSKLYNPNLTNAEINDIIYRIYDLRAHQAVQISPLFISYSHADTAFVDKLEEGLTKKGIRFWRDIKHGTAGKLERQVDRAMKLNDTVLLVLSEHSVNSDWVELEAAKARKLEKETKKDVLCPIALDDSWKDCNWTESMRYQIKKYNVLDFSGWDDEGVFTRQFARLLDGLEIFYE